MGRQRLVQYFFFGVFLLLIYEVLRMFSAFHLALLSSAVLAFMSYPLHRRVRARLSGYPNLAAALTTALALLIVVVPALLLSWIFVKDAASLYPAARVSLEDFQRWRSIPLEARLSAWNIDLGSLVLKALDQFSERMTHLATALITNVVFILLNLLLLAFALFFFLRDGDLMIGRALELVPMPADHKEAILERLRETLGGVVYGALMVGAVQGVITGVGFALFRVPYPIPLGFFTFVLSFVPFGNFVVLLPVVSGLILAGSVDRAIYVAAWCLGLVGLIDHILRPLLIGVRTGMPLLFLFFALLGGVQLYGILGILLGPLVVALTMAFANIYSHEYRWLLSAEPAPKA